MGAKYQPSIKDQKAHQRFQQQQRVQSKFIKPAAKPAIRAAKKPGAPDGTAAANQEGESTGHK